MSVSLSTPEPLEAPGAPVRLRLVPQHEHLWRLLTVEYDDGLEVRCYECTDCRDVQYR